MTNRELTKTELEQIIWYLNQSTIREEYYGRKDYFYKRRLNIINWVGSKLRELEINSMTDEEFQKSVHDMNKCL